MDMILERYRTRLLAKGGSPATLTNFDKAARAFQRWLDARGLTARDVKEWDVYEFLESLELAASTKRTHMIHVKAAFNYAHKHGAITANPVADIVLKLPADQEPTIIGNDELREMRGRIIEDRAWLVFHLLAYTGMRQGEIRALKWGDVNFPESSLRVVGKGRKLRHVPIHPTLQHVLVTRRGDDEEYVVTTLGRKPVAYDTWMADLKTFSAGYTAHAFRRTVATSLARNGVEERIIDRIMGWAPPTVGRRYYVNVATEEMQRAILRLYANDPV